jgi:spore coat polysaccharide biosynthesis protein SpsF (cytidylyltransferase family)
MAIDAIAPGALRRPTLRLTVDTPEDLDYVRKVFGRLVDTSVPASLTEIIRAADRLHLSEAGGSNSAARGTR